MKKRHCILGMLLLVAAVCAVCGFLLVRHHAGTDITPQTETVYTSTRYITSLALTPDGELWAGTLGGILQRKSDGVWRKFTRLDGLPSHEVRRMEASCEGSIMATLPTGRARWTHQRWELLPLLMPPAGILTLPDETCHAQWQGIVYAANASGLFRQEGTHWQSVKLPPSSGSHVSALLPVGHKLWAALFGAGLWEYDGNTWQPLALNLPGEAREITAMAGNAQTLWVGTRRAGLWEYRSRTWIQHLQRDEPVDHNCQALTVFGGSLFVSTMEDGLAIRTAQGWGHAQAMPLSSNAPRQMVVFQNCLYLRHGNGKVDRFDGKTWERNVCALLPHRQVSALAADAHILYAAQWGGWSAFDGKTWTHHLDLAELQGLPITALCPHHDTLWIGTQGHGLAEAQGRSGAFLRWHDEHNGLPDDWITTLTCIDDTLYAGTFVGGLAHWNGQDNNSYGSPVWTTEAALKRENVTALEPDGAGGLFIATRAGLWHGMRNGSFGRVEPVSQSGMSFLDKEMQALCRVEGGLWIGTRTGLFFCCPNEMNFFALEPAAECSSNIIPDSYFVETP